MPKQRGNGGRPSAPTRAPRTPRGIPRGQRVSAIADAWDVSPDHVYALIATGELTAVRLPGKGTRAGAIIVLDEDLLKFLERHRDRV